MNFKEKSQDELANMSEAEVASYFSALQDHKNAALKSAIEAGVKSDIEKLKAELIEVGNKRTESITKALEAQGLALAKLTAQNGSVVKADSLDAHVGKLKSMKEDNFQGKVLITKSMTIGANFPTYSRPQYDPNVGRLASRRPFIQNLLNARALTATGQVSYVQQTARTGDAGVTGEGLAKNSMDTTWEQVLVNAKKVTAYTKTSTESIDDIPFMESLIQSEIMDRIALKVDEQLLTGSGLGNNMSGIFTTATSFSAGSFALSVVNANRYDVLAIAVTQVYTQNFTPNYILLNPIDVAQMDVTKTTSGEYVMPSFISSDGREIKSTPIILNNGIPAGQYLVMDSTQADVYTRQDVTITIGRENDDLTKNFITVVGEWRGLCVVKAVNTGAFVKGTFATDIAAILKP